MNELLLNIVGQQFSWENILEQIIRAALVGGFAQLMLWIFGIKLGSTIRHIVFWVSVPLFILVLGAFIKYTNPPIDQRAKVPELKGRIDQTLVASIISKEQGGVSGLAVTLVVSIRNIGSPSIVENWSLSITPLGASSLDGVGYDIPEKLTLEGSSGVKYFSRDDAIYEKVTTNPIPEGGMQRGILLFIFEGIERDSIIRPGSNMSLRFKDVMEKEYVVEDIWPTKPSDKITYIPGLTRIPPKITNR